MSSIAIKLNKKIVQSAREVGQVMFGRARGIVWVPGGSSSRLRVGEIDCSLGIVCLQSR